MIIKLPRSDRRGVELFFLRSDHLRSATVRYSVTGTTGTPGSPGTPGTPGAPITCASYFFRGLEIGPLAETVYCVKN